MAAENPGPNAETAAPERDHHHRAFGHSFWMLNSIEMFERLAYFGIRSVVPVYIMQATEPGGLHMTAAHKGLVYAWWAVFQSFLPMVTGGIADRYGYKRVLAMAISANAVGYLMMALMPSYYGFFSGIIVLATGTAFFKPALQGSLAQSLTRENSSLGWGVFYWVVNVGAVCAPILATPILGKPHSAEGWRNLFIASAIYTSMNLLLLLTFRDVPSGADKTVGAGKVFWQTIENIWPYWFRGGTMAPGRAFFGGLLFLLGLSTFFVPAFAGPGAGRTTFGWLTCILGVLTMLWFRGGTFVWQLRLPAFLLIMSCFWMMMYQLWDLHPNFIEDWVDSAAVAAVIPFEAWTEYGDRGLVRVPQQILLNLNAFLIVLLVVPVSWLVRKMRTLSSMLIGMSVATAGILVAGLTGNGWILLLGIVFFSLGEMLTGPKKNEYLGRIAPKGKKGLYLGYVNIPIGVGVGIGSWIAGLVYGTYGEKASLALEHLAANPELVARAAASADWSDSLELLPELLDVRREDALAMAANEMDLDTDEAASALRDIFRYDTGQVTNLGLMFLALSDEYKRRVALRMAEKPAAGDRSFDEENAARFVHLLPSLLDIKRPAMFEILRDRVNTARPSGQKLYDSQIVDMLWERFGRDPETLNNLALEYLAQGTGRLQTAVEGIDLDGPADFERRLGISRTKSFAALSAATGADDTDVKQVLAEADDPTLTESDRVFAFLASQPHYRFLAVARRDWTQDAQFLQKLIETDDAARNVVITEWGQVSWYARLWNGITSMFSSDEEPRSDGVDYLRLAERQDLIQRALRAKDWKLAPEHARQLLRKNRFEARALAAAEINGSPVAATKLLWETYRPHLFVWLPFAVVGVLATIALGIFGRLARRWADMDA